MKERIKDENQLLDALRQLPREIKPHNELWPGIESRLSHHGQPAATRVRNWPMRALAASVVVAFVAGLMFGRQGTLVPPLQETPLQQARESASRAMLAATEATEREYQAAFREFIPVGAARAMLSSETIQNIEQSWAELQQTELALMAALHDYPDNSFLNQKLLDLRSQQLGFMQQLATLDQLSWRRT